MLLWVAFVLYAFPAWGFFARLAFLIIYQYSPMKALKSCWIERRQFFFEICFLCAKVVAPDYVQM